MQWKSFTKRGAVNRLSSADLSGGDSLTESISPEHGYLKETNV